MRKTTRKLQLNTQTLRALTSPQLARAAGGLSSVKASMCSTFADTGCSPSGNTWCQSGGCPSFREECGTNLC